MCTCTVKDVEFVVAVVPSLILNFFITTKTMTTVIINLIIIIIIIVFNGLGDTELRHVLL